jgi:hypothetical protein
MKGITILFLAFSNLCAAQIALRGVDSFEPLVASYKAEFTSMLGYRIQICFDNNKSVVDEAKNKFLTSYPKTPVYMVFENPNFNLMVGDFRTLIAAEKIRAKIQGEYTISVIHKTTIKLPRVD